MWHHDTNVKMIKYLTYTAINEIITKRITNWLSISYAIVNCKTFSTTASDTGAINCVSDNIEALAKDV